MSDARTAAEVEDLASLVGRIADECQERLNRGEQFDVEEYARRLAAQVNGQLASGMPAALK